VVTDVKDLGEVPGVKEGVQESIPESRDMPER